jgi:2,4-dienoyl-CoA reductase-like NADH-dependent reductase (Old Yellow Enzyme family)
VIAEATGVSPEGRISPSDLGIWNDEQMNAFSRIAAYIKSQDSVPGIQLAHAGRKASNAEPWNGGKPVAIGAGGWQTFGPSALAFDQGWPAPREITKTDMKKVVDDFVAATKRAERAGFEVLEIHMAHGYLLNEFLSPLSNERKDEYGGSIENRMRFPLEVARAVRATWPQRLPLFTRISASDWVEGGWTIDDSVVLSRELRAVGIDLIDCSSGGNHPHAKIEVKPGYQVPFAERVKRDAGIASGAVGLIVDAKQAEEIIASGKADAVLIARELLRNPYWPLHAAFQLGVKTKWPKQYERAAPRL